MKELLNRLKNCGLDVRPSCPLAPHSSFRVGGCAALAAFPDSKEGMIIAMRCAAERGIRFSVFGNASNVVFADEGFDGLIIFTGAYRTLSADGDKLEASCGVPLARLAVFAADRGLRGAAFLHGIPGTVGGAVPMNAGAYEGSVSDICIRSEYWDRETGELGVLEGDAHRFGYRTSIYTQQERYVLLEAQFAMERGDPAEIRAQMAEYAERRRRTQPLEYPSAGSVFKRPAGSYAGKLIQDCGLKGYTVGGAQVSEKHAGFIINRGNATAADIRALTAHVQQVVLEQTGVMLECEIRFIAP